MFPPPSNQYGVRNREKVYWRVNKVNHYYCYYCLLSKKTLTRAAWVSLLKGAACTNISPNTRKLDENYRSFSTGSVPQTWTEPGHKIKSDQNWQRKLSPNIPYFNSMQSVWKDCKKKCVINVWQDLGVSKNVNPIQLGFHEEKSSMTQCLLHDWASPRNKSTPTYWCCVS